MVMNKAMSESDVVLDVRTDIEATEERPGGDRRPSKSSFTPTPTYTTGTWRSGDCLTLFACHRSLLHIHIHHIQTDSLPVPVPIPY